MSFFQFTASDWPYEIALISCILQDLDIEKSDDNLNGLRIRQWTNNYDDALVGVDATRGATIWSDRVLLPDDLRRVEKLKADCRLALNCYRKTLNTSGIVCAFVNSANLNSH
jgi:hypothetical protein